MFIVCGRLRSLLRRMLGGDRRKGEHCGMIDVHGRAQTITEDKNKKNASTLKITRFYLSLSLSVTLLTIPSFGNSARWLMTMLLRKPSQKTSFFAQKEKLLLSCIKKWPSTPNHQAEWCCQHMIVVKNNWDSSPCASHHGRHLLLPKRKSYYWVA